LRTPCQSAGSSVSSPCQSPLVSPETNAVADDGTTAAAPVEPVARALAQPATTTAIEARTGISRVVISRPSLLGRLAPHQPPDEAREALAREYRADAFRYRQLDPETKRQLVE